MSSLINFLEGILVWLKDLLLWLPRKLTELVLDGLAALVEAIPVPGFFSSADGYLSSLHPQILYILDVFQIGEGLTILMSALVIRFLIRRTPVIG